MDVREVFRRQAEHFEALGSPVYARLAERLAGDPEPAAGSSGTSSPTSTIRCASSGRSTLSSSRGSLQTP